MKKKTFTIVKEWRAYADDDFVDSEDVEVFDNEGDAIKRAEQLNESETAVWEAGNSLWEYTCFSISVEVFMNGSIFGDDYIEPEDVGFVKPGLPKSGDVRMFYNYEDKKVFAENDADILYAYKETVKDVGEMSFTDFLDDCVLDWESPVYEITDKYRALLAALRYAECDSSMLEDFLSDGTLTIYDDDSVRCIHFGNGSLDFDVDIDSLKITDHSDSIVSHVTTSSRFITAKTLSFIYNDETLYVDITIDTEGNIYEAWMYHADYSVKMSMFAESMSSGETISDFTDVVIGSLRDYAATYYDEYMR